MQHLRNYRVPLIVAAIIGGCVLFVGCNDAKPTEPLPSVPKDYVVYLRNIASEPILYAYHPATRRLDSMEFPYLATRGLTVSADGKRLYAAERYVVRVIDTDSFGLVYEYHSDSLLARLPVAVSPDNRWAAICGTDLYVLSTEDYSVVYYDTAYVREGIFSSDSRTFYGIGRASLYMLHDPGGANIVETRVISQRSLQRVVPTPDEQTLLTFASNVFEVYDVSTDSIIFSLSQGCSQAGWIGVTPDGRYAFYGHPGNIYGPGNTDFTIFDIAANRVDTVLSTATMVDYPYPPYREVGTIAVTPDGRWLVALEGGPSPHSLFLFDVQKMRFADYHWFGYGRRFLNPSVQLNR